MQAIQVQTPGGPDALEYVDVAQPVPGPGQALVKIDAAGVNFIDVYQRTGQYKVATPFTLGQEAGGTVAALGPGISGLKVGHRVAYAGVLGAYAEFAAVPADRLVVLPNGVSTKQGAAAMLQGMTAQYLATTTYPLKAGDTCLVHAAAGGVGQLLCQVAKLRGARVIGTVLTEGAGLQVVYDSVGQTTFTKGLNCLAPRGMMVLYGQSSGPVGPFDPQVLNQKGSLFLTRPTLHHYIASREELALRAEEVFDWVREEKLRVRIAAELPLAQAAEAHRLLEGRRTTGKVLLIP